MASERFGDLGIVCLSGELMPHRNGTAKSKPARDRTKMQVQGLCNPPSTQPGAPTPRPIHAGMSPVSNQSSPKSDPNH